jgi:hypothetical protein
MDLSHPGFACPDVHAATGELLRELVIDPGRDYQPTGFPKVHSRSGSIPN